MKVKNNVLGEGLIIFFALIPIVIWVLMKPLSLRFFGPSSVLTSIGQLSGLVGFSLFALVMLLNTRMKFIDRLFSGVNEAYVTHHNLGTISFSLLLLHPLALTATYLFLSISFAFNFLVTNNVTNLAGEIGLLLMMLLLILTFFTRLSYETWKSTHKFLGLAFIFAAFHVFFVSSDVSNNIAMRTYILLMMSIGFWSVLYRTVLGKYLVKKHIYIVENVNPISNDLIEITMSPKDEPIRFKPGQFLFISFNDNTVGIEPHPFSIASSPNDNKLRITAKALGDFTGRLKVLKNGVTAEIEGAFGGFSYLDCPKENKQIWIAGGVGLIPFLSMARSLTPDNEYDINLHYCVRSRSELAFMDELKEISSKIRGFKVVPFCSDEEGRITAEAINERNGGMADKEIFICGPPSMMESLSRQLEQIGVKITHIHVEEFRLYGVA